ncbi:formimidoylglutamate deiminase [Haloechinothrix sp. YIM 98757]|uniref:Formimidoylglutamate deiminase n=1 Tax=Haloechinothrix aidingensis TaxID=2752311 RepID=A0A838ACX4_9PSEU|nr:formimidoylglutamate deiminase [Haloechinothrix aidingensis]
MTGVSQTYWCEHAWLPDGPAPAVALTVDDGRISAVTRDAPRAGTVLTGLVLPGFANVHSHAFHRALRGRTHGGGGTFWTWRDRMYRLVERLDPDSCYRIARAVFAEMLLAGYTSVGEFHYVHHDRAGRRYADQHAMAHALVSAAGEVGIKLTVLDTCYLTGGIGGERLDPVQYRFSDGDVDAWAARAAAFDPGAAHVRVGAAVHSVRAVPAEHIPVVVAWSRERAVPLHAHVSEQRAENQACQAAYGRSPVQLLAEAGALDERFVAVHATHASALDATWLGSSDSWVCLCPTTEQDLGDGTGPARELANAGARLSVGSDSQAVVDPFAELRSMEMAERLGRESRGHFTPAELIGAGTAHAAIGWPDTGRLEQGSRADLVRVTLDSPRTAGSDPAGVPLCASASDIRDVLVDGQWLVREGEHLRVADPAARLAAAVQEVTA